MRVVHCKREPSTKYIGRGSIYGNPFTHLPVGSTKASVQVGSIDEAVDSFEGVAAWRSEVGPCRTQAQASDPASSIHRRDVQRRRHFRLLLSAGTSLSWRRARQALAGDSLRHYRRPQSLRAMSRLPRRHRYGHQHAQRLSVCSLHILRSRRSNDPVHSTVLRYQQTDIQCLEPAELTQIIC